MTARYQSGCWHTLDLDCVPSSASEGSGGLVAVTGPSPDALVTRRVAFGRAAAPKMSMLMEVQFSEDPTVRRFHQHTAFALPLRHAHERKLEPPEAMLRAVGEVVKKTDTYVRLVAETRCPEHTRAFWVARKGPSHAHCAHLACQLVEQLAQREDTVFFQPA